MSSQSSPALKRYIRQRGVLALVPVSPATLWRWIKAGKFVSPVKLSAGVTAWDSEKVQAWLDEQAERAIKPKSAPTL